jgi:hypothetical protein
MTNTKGAMTTTERLLMGVVVAAVLVVVLVSVARWIQTVIGVVEKQWMGDEQRRCVNVGA